MSQSLSKIYLHIIFGTKNWQPIIKEPHNKKLHSYLVGVCKNVNCAPIAVNGHLNHVLILCRFAKNITVSDLLEALKTQSSTWMKQQDDSLKNFYWQKGYAAFSIAENSVENVRHYIDTQEEHHSRVSYREEIVKLIQEHGLEYDERYFWD